MKNIKITLFVFYCIFTIAIFPSTVFPECSDMKNLYQHALKQDDSSRKISMLEKVRVECPGNFVVFYELGKAIHTLCMEKNLPPEDELWAKAIIQFKDVLTTLANIQSLAEQQKKLKAGTCVHLGEIYERVNNIYLAKFYYKMAISIIPFKMAEERLIDLEYHHSTKGLDEQEIMLGFKTAKAYGVEPTVDIPIHFEYDSSMLTSTPGQDGAGGGISGIEQAGKLGNVISAPGFSQNSFLLIGHTDIHGSDAYNDKLSRERAESVKRYLVDNFNIPSHRITTRGDGKRNLKIQGSSEKIDAINRRVEIVIIN
ncbi:hypothetical protein MTBBW1_1020013 [Desulfamplus magnetovallimortis]|uniref:OmpA-like domain-containing protein n=1 Tax=Desulfamplus magnetovallimortis TaxID=1246637 RepID=A0A1W1H4T9_9BACT|nr:OmpA family protein [Desulfamplus magnetovallimortis]SLM27489.1 hypothetical protein MTBBW1_1020013 [Desulfamplus magnetovallimortis]